jgi:LemA protein
MAWVVLLCIVVGIALVGLLWYVVVYNRFVSLRNHLKESWADVDVELKRRYDLIPNLVRTVKGYAAHEKDVFESITQARAAAVANTGDPSHQSGDEQRLVGQLGRLFVVAEAYPELKADRNFLDLQEELSNTEDRIAAARRFFNGNVRELNTLRESFPSSIVAGIAKVEAAGYFEITDHTERATPKV